MRFVRFVSPLLVLLFAGNVFATDVVTEVPLETTVSPSDISEGHKNFQAIQYLYENKILQGYPDGTFQPERTVNRAEMLKILIEGRGISPDSDKYNNCFPDVKNDWYAPYVCYAKESGWIEGYPDGTFKPEQTVNKVESIKMVVETREDLREEIPEVVPEDVYEDVDRSAWYAPYVYVAKEKGLLEETDVTFAPSEGMSRSGISENIYRAMKIQEENKEEFEEVQYKELFVPDRDHDVTVKVKTEPKQYALGASDASLLDFSITAKETIRVESIKIRFTATPNPFPQNAGKGNLINSETNTPNFTDFKIIDADAGFVYLGPIELNTNGDISQILTFHGDWAIQEGLTVYLSMIADIANEYEIANFQFFATILDMSGSKIYDSNGNRITDIFPARDLKGGFVTPRVNVDLNVGLSSISTIPTAPSGASHVDFMKISFTAGSADDAQLRGLKLRYVNSKLTSGIPAQDGGIELYLYEGETRLTGKAVFDPYRSLFSFDTLGTRRTQVIMPGQTRIFTVRGYVNISEGSQIHFEIPDSSYLETTAPSVSGKFPLISTTQTISGSIDHALIVKKKYADLSPQAGQKNAQIAAFQVTSPRVNEKRYLGYVALRMEGNVPLNHINNFVLKRDGVTIAQTPSTINEMGEDLVFFQVDPVVSLDNDETFEVYADISASAQKGEDMSFFMDESADLVVYNEAGYSADDRYAYYVVNHYDNRKWYSEYSSWSYVDIQTTPMDNVTFYFTGPVAQDVPVKSQDVHFMDLSIISEKNIEVQKLEFYLYAKKGDSSADPDDLLNSNHPVDTDTRESMNFQGIRVIDSDTGESLMGVVNLSATSSQSDSIADVYQSLPFSGSFNVDAGKTKNISLVMNIADNANLAGQQFYVLLISPDSQNGIKDRDSGSYISDITPSSNILGNLVTVAASTETAPADDSKLKVSLSNELRYSLPAEFPSSSMPQGEGQRYLFGVDLKNTSTETAYLADMELTHSGSGDLDDFDGIYFVNDKGNYTVQGTNFSGHTIYFGQGAGMRLPVEPSQSVAVFFYVSVKDTAELGNEHVFSLTDITLETPLTLSGLPITSETFTISGPITPNLTLEVHAIDTEIWQEDGSAIFFAFSLESNRDVTVRALEFQLDILNGDSDIDSGDLLDSDSDTANFTNFRLVNTATDQIIVGPWELSTGQINNDDEFDFRQAFQFTEPFYISGRQSTKFQTYALMADVPHKAFLDGEALRVSLSLAPDASIFVDSSTGEQISAIQPDTDILEGPYVTVKMQQYF